MHPNWSQRLIMAILIGVGITWVGPDTLWAGFLKSQPTSPHYTFGMDVSKMPGQALKVPVSQGLGFFSPTEKIAPPKRRMSLQQEDEKLNLFPVFSAAISELYVLMES